MSETILNVGDDSFATQVLQAELPVLVDFWAPWCGPCQMLAPTLAALASEFTGRLKVVKVNVDEQRQIALTYGVRSIPTLILFNQGYKIAEHRGILAMAQLRSLVRQSI